MNLFTSETQFAQIIAFYHVDLKHFEMQAHEHSACEIMYVKKGKCLVTTPSEEHLLHSGEFIFIDSGIEHCLSVPKQHSCELLNIEFILNTNGPGIFFGEIREHCLVLGQKQLPLRIADQSNLGVVLLELVDQLAHQRTNPNQDGLTDLRIQLLFQHMLLELAVNFQQTTTSQHQPYVALASQYIREHLFEELTIEGIAKQVGLNHSYLQNLFKQQTNKTIVQTIQQLRIEQACFLLSNSNLSITDIAFEVGFNSRQHFGKTFDRLMQCSPKAFRQQNSQSKVGGSKTAGQFRRDHTDWSLLKM